MLVESTSGSCIWMSRLTAYRIPRGKLFIRLFWRAKEELQYHFLGLGQIPPTYTYLLIPQL